MGTQIASTTEPIFLTKGTKVIYTDRQGVIIVGLIERVEKFRSYHDPSVVLGYYQISGVPLMVPAEDHYLHGDIEVVERVEDVI